MKRGVLLTLLAFSLFTNCIAQKPSQTIRGVVYDAVTKETLPGANIILIDENIGVTTDLNGDFLLEKVEVGRYNLQVSFMGYEPLIIPELLVGSGREVLLDIALEQSVSELDGVVIKATIRKDKPINSMATVSARTFSVEEARRYAGALDDPGRMAGNFAGVTPVAAHQNAIVVRGNAPKGLLWRLEGIDIPVPSHFSGSNIAGGGGLTMFSSQLLANSDFYTGAFPAEFGNASAGVFDMKLRNGNSQRHEYAFQIGVQGIEAAAEGPFKKNQGSSFLINYRYSTMALIFPLLPEVKGANELPIYQDLSFKIQLPTAKAGQFSIWGIGGLSESSMKGYDEVDEWIYPENRVKMKFNYNMGVAGITHTQGLTSKAHLRTTIALNSGQHKYKEEARLFEDTPSVLHPLFYVESTEGMATLNSTLSIASSSRLSFKTGIDVNLHYYSLNGDSRDFQAGDYGNFLSGEGTGADVKAFAQAKYSVTQNFYFNAGANVSWFELNNELRVEPRLSASWQANPQNRFSLGYGNHSQIEPLFVYFVSKANTQTGELYFPNMNLKRMGAHHFVLGYDFSPSQHLRIKVEPYYQYLYNVPVVDGEVYSMVNFMSDWTFDKSLVNNGTGENIGIDLTIERFLKDGYYYLVTSSLYKSQYTDGNGVKQKSRYNGGYVINLVGGKEWTIRKRNLLGINAKVAFFGPYWHQPVDIDKTQLRGDIVYNEQMPFTYRHSNLETISDLTLTYRINHLGASSVFALQIKNIIGKQYLGKKYNLQTQEVEDDFFTSPVPFISYKIEF